MNEAAQVEKEAWKSLLHEVAELRLNKTTNLYMGLVNALINLIETLTEKHGPVFFD